MGAMGRVEDDEYCLWEQQIFADEHLRSMHAPRFRMAQQENFLLELSQMFY
jgi:hypothetical protein